MSQVFVVYVSSDDFNKIDTSNFYEVIERGLKECGIDDVFIVDRVLEAKQ